MRLIDADGLMKNLPPEEMCSRFAVENAPAIDAVTVIRCKDCGHWDYCDSGIDGTAQGECFMLSMITDDMCFCCWAERKEE